MRYFLVLLLAGVLSSCQTPAPTTTTNQTNIPEKSVAKSEANFKSFLEKSPVILDARSPLDFQVSHAPRAINVQWDDFSRTGNADRGWLVDDDMDIAKRLSLWGIDPETPVLVLGYGPKGKGEEGRIAWMLKYLGVKNVQIAEWSLVRSTIPREEGLKENKPLWKPKVKPDYLATWDEFKKNILQPPRPPSRARSAALQMGGGLPALDESFAVLDVTGVDANSSIFPLHVTVKKVFWKDFLTEHGTPDESAKKLMDQNHITRNRVIYVVSENGVSSGLVTFILREWGYSAENFAGGYDFLRREIK
jgi:thiosulfate/3-mercaptopyruvate sulfurtransferase